MAADVTPSGLPPQVALYHLAIGFYVSRALGVIAQLGIADLLKDGPRPASLLADATGTDAPSLNRVLRLLATAGVFEEQADGAFALTPLGECLRTGVPGSAHAMIMLFAGNSMHEAWRDLEYCVRTGDPVFRKRGLDGPFSEQGRTPEDAAKFDAAMADFTRLAAFAVAANYDFSALRTVVDVGGGNGALLIGILKAHPHLHGIVFDQPPAAERATQQIAQRRLADRCTAVGGNFFTEVPRGGDAYVLKHVIHDWNDERAAVILANCHRAMDERGTLLVVEGVYPPHVDGSIASQAAAANDVNMLVNTGGRQRSEAEFRTLYDTAGFVLTKIIPTPAGICIIEGVRK